MVFFFFFRFSLVAFSRWMKTPQNRQCPRYPYEYAFLWFRFRSVYIENIYSKLANNNVQYIWATWSGLQDRGDREEFLITAQGFFSRADAILRILIMYSQKSHYILLNIKQLIDKCYGMLYIKPFVMFYNNCRALSEKILIKSVSQNFSYTYVLFPLPLKAMSKHFFQTIWKGIVKSIFWLIKDYL